MEATLENNLSACSKKELNNKDVIAHCSKVIIRQPYLFDVTILFKAYTRRGLAYEELEKFPQAKEDMLTVKTL